MLGWHEALCRLFASELASIPTPDQRLDDTGAAIVGRDLGIAILLTAVGFLAAGIAAMLARLWCDRRRFTLLGESRRPPCPA